MKSIQLGQSDMHGSPICLGTMTFGEQVDENIAHVVLDCTLARGIDLIDTAEMDVVPIREQTYGATETIIERWFTKHPGAGGRMTLPTRVAGPLLERHVPAFDALQYDPTKETSTTPIHAQLEALAGLMKADKMRRISVTSVVHDSKNLARRIGAKSI